MKITMAQAIALFTGLGFATADKWNAERMNLKLDKLSKIIDDPDEVDPAVIEDKATRKLFDKIKAEFKDDGKVTVEEEEAEKPAAKEEAAEEKPAKKKSSLADDDDEAPAKADKKADKAEKSEKPAKVKKAAGGKKDEHGFREGSAISRIAAAMTNKPQSHGEIMKSAKHDGTNYEALAKLVKAKIAVRVEAKDGSNAWKLA
jgi:hypothetical protein